MIFNSYRRYKNEIGVAIVPWEMKGDNKKESYSNLHFKRLKETDNLKDSDRKRYSAGNLFLHDSKNYRIIDQEQWGVRLPNNNFLKDWWDQFGDYILLLGDCDFNKFQQAPKGELEAARSIFKDLTKNKESCYQRKESLRDQVHTFTWVHKDILKHLTGSQFAIPLGDYINHNGKKKRSKFELFFAGKFLRCGEEYKGELDFYNLPKMSADEFLELVDKWEDLGMNRKNIHKDLKEAKRQKEYTQDITGSEEIQDGEYKDTNHLKLILDKFFSNGASGYNQGRAFLQYVKAYDSYTGNNSSKFLLRHLEKITGDPAGLIRGYPSTTFSKEHKEAIENLLKEKENTFTLKEGEYLSDNEELLNALKNIKGVVLLDGGCGIGKTTAAVKYLAPCWDGPTILAVPTTAIKNQVARSHGIRALGGKDADGKKLPTVNSVINRMKDGEIYVCCYEALKDTALVDLIRINLIIDEGHKITDDAGYRQLNFLCSRLKVVKRGLILSGTTWDIPEVYDKVIKVEGGQKFPVNIYRVIGKGKTFTTRQKIATFKKLRDNCIKYGIPLLVVCDTKLELKEKYLGFKITRSNEKDSEEFKALIDGWQFQLSGFTMIINEGISIETAGRVAVWVDVEPQGTKASTFIQLPQRWRKADKIDMYVVDKKNTKKWYSEDEVKKDIVKSIKTLNREAEFYNIFDDVHATIFQYLKMDDMKFQFREEMFKTFYKTINSNSAKTEGTLKFVSRRMGWNYKEISIEDLGEDEKEVGKTPPKTTLRKVFIEKNEKENLLKGGTVTLWASLIRGEKIENNEFLMRRYRDLVSNFFECIEDDGVKEAVSRLVKQFKKADDLRLELENYFRTAKNMTFIPSPELCGHIVGDKGYFIGTRRLANIQKIISEKYGHIFTIGQASKNEKIVRYCLKKLNLKVKKTKDQKNCIVYRSLIVAKPRTLEYKAQKLKEKELLELALLY